MRKLVQRFWGTLILLVLVVAVGVQLGREAFPLLNDYREAMAARLSDMLEVDVEIGAIEARWVGLRPRVELRDVAMRSEHSEILTVGRVEGELSLVNSLREWQLIWRKLEFSQLHMQFEQADSGRWNLGGINLARPRVDEDAVQDPLDIFLLSRHLTLNDSTFLFRFRTGHQAELTVPELVLENEDDFHRLAANFAVDGDKEAFSVVVEGHGNPRAENNFTVAGYVALEDFPMEKVVAALDISAWDASGEGQWSEGHRLDTNLWFDGNPYRDVRLRGFMRADGLPLKAPNDMQLPAGLQADVTGRWRHERGWQVSLQRAELYWDKLTAPLFNLSVAGAFDRPIQLAVDEIDIATWHALAVQTGLLQGKLKEALAELAPRGRLANVYVEQRPPEAGSFLLRANLRGVQVDSYVGAPAIASLDGFIEATTLTGRVVIDSRDGFSMFYPQVYHEPMTYDRAQGEVRWAVRQDLERVEVFSGPLSLSGAEGRGRGAIHLQLPFGNASAAPSMTLLVGLQDSHARFYSKYVPYVVPDGLNDWLRESIRGGLIPEAGFLWHGSLVQGEGEPPPVIQLFGRVQQAELKFSPEWPALVEGQGRVVLDNQALDIDIERGFIDGNRIQRAAVTLRSSGDQPMVLSVVGRAAGDLDSALQLLRASPIGDYLGSQFASWRGRGTVAAELDLRIPLFDKTSGEAEPGEGHTLKHAGGETSARHQVRVDLADAQLIMPRLGLTFEQITGSLLYTNSAGLNSPGLDLAVWGHPMQARFATSVVDQQPRDLNIQFSGAIAAQDLAEWLDQPALNAIAVGSADVQGHIIVPFARDAGALSGIDIELTTDLRGVAVKLPAPYTKAPADKLPVSLFATLTESQLFRISYGDLLRAQFVLDDGLESVSLAFGEEFQPLEPGYLDISGRVGVVHLPAWQNVVKELASAARAPVGTGFDGIDSWPVIPRFDLHLDALQLDQFALDELYLSGEHAYGRWRVDMRSPQLFGQLLVFDDGRPLEVDLASVRLPAAETEQDADSDEAAAAVSMLKRIDLTRLPAMDFSTASLKSNAKDYGAWSFELRPVDGGIVLRNLRGRVMGLSIGADEGGELVWLQSRDRHSTYLRSRITTGDLGQVLKNLGQPELLESQSARFDLELLWPGAPDEARIELLEGSVVLDVRNGRFIRGAEAGNNPFLRLFGLLNFDTLARRLKLDFSDLYKEGMVFDAVEGKLQFAKGQVVVREPLRVQSPSSTLQFAGVIDATSEQLDASLVATLPMSGNLAIAAAFVGGLPAALGVYAVSKVFKEQVDRASSIRYRISGAWDDPSIRVDRIFESSTEADRAQLLNSPVTDPELPEVGLQGVAPDRQPLSGEPTLESRRPPQH